MSRQTTTRPPSGTALSSCCGSYCLRSPVSSLGHLSPEVRRSRLLGQLLAGADLKTPEARVRGHTLHFHRIARPPIPFVHAGGCEQTDPFVLLVGHGDMGFDAGIDGIQLGAQDGAIGLVDPETSPNGQVAATRRGDEGGPRRLPEFDLDARVGLVALAEPELEAAAMTFGEKRKRQRGSVDVPVDV